jgi:hypothetical protein
MTKGVASAVALNKVYTLPPATTLSLFYIEFDWHLLPVTYLYLTHLSKTA